MWEEMTMLTLKKTLKVVLTLFIESIAYFLYFFELN